MEEMTFDIVTKNSLNLILFGLHETNPPKKYVFREGRSSCVYVSGIHGTIFNELNIAVTTNTEKKE